MSISAEEVDLETEDEIDESPYVEFDISVSPSDPTLELLTQQLAKDDILIPFYQRKYVWKIEQASRLIESFLMGLPVPQVFLYVNKENQLEVIDGQQRLMSVKYFFEGYFGEEDGNDKRQVFKLRGLSERSEYNGKTFSELLPRDQRKLKNSTLRAINIRQIKPSDTNDSVYHIFERLNTGGTRLKSQEIRNAVFRGNIVNELATLNNLPAWRTLLGVKKPDRSQKDVELILRLFSLFETWQTYEKPMLAFLNRSMDMNRSFTSERALRFKARFPSAVGFVASTLSKPFRPKGIINSAVLEAVMIAILEGEDLTPEQLQKGYLDLIDNNEFLKYISGSTTNTASVQTRISIAKQVIYNVAP